MRKIIKSMVLFLVALAMIIGTLPVTAYSGENSCYIRNNYTTGSYMYEDDGVLRYGIPMASDPRFQWQLEAKGEYKVIKNLATGRCITLEGHADETVEGYWGDIVSCLDYEEGNDTFLWDCTKGEGQNIISGSVKYAKYALHLENVTNGQVSSQKLSDDQLNWGNMKWDFVNEKDINFSSMQRDGFCIQNVENGKYLRVDKGILTYGDPNGPDNVYIWTFEQQQNGSRAIKNKLTSQFISLTGSDGKDPALGCIDFIPGDRSFLWSIQVSSETSILSANPDYSGYGLYIENSSDNKVRCGEIVSREDYPQPNMKWNIVNANDVAGVVGPLILEEGIYNLKNSWYGLYLIEENGVPVYGNTKPSEPFAQWRIIFNQESGLTALKNEGTGHFLHVNGSGKLVCDETESYWWRLNRNKNLSYPDAVEFQDHLDPKSFLHMESLSGIIENSNAVQPSWGTPHWEPIKVDTKMIEAAGDKDNDKIPEGFIRLESRANKGEYLYEKASGALVYGECKATDARSHWELVKNEAEGGYLLRNREYENYVNLKSNGTIRCVEESEAASEGSLWQVSFGEGDNILMFNNADSRLSSFKRPYLNIRKQTGLVQCNLVSSEEAATQWIYEAAQEETVSAEASEETKVPILAYPDSNIYKISDDGQLLNSTYKLEYIGNRVRIIDTADNQYLYYENGWKTKPLEDNYDLSVQWEDNSKAGVKGLKKEKIKLQLYAVPSDSVYKAENAYVSGNQKIFTVYAHEADTYQVGINYSGKAATTELKVNGISQGTTVLPLKKNMALVLNKGINTISLGDSKNSIKEITLYNSINKNYRGATAAVKEYEAEDCITTGNLIEDDRTYRSLSSEASGRQAINLDGTGQYVKFSLTEAANSIVIRYCIPDSDDGSGLEETLNLYIDGKKSQSIELTSKFSWVYGVYPWTNNPTDGQAHHFYDEARVLLDKTYPAGTVFKLQKDSANHAAYYIIDFIETEDAPEANKQPGNSLSILEFGALPNDGGDDTKALTDCINAAADLGKEIWIPEGIFEINNSKKDFDAGDNQDKNRGIVISKANVTIRGAGMWRSVLKGEYAAFFIKADNISLYDFSLSGAAVNRRDSIDPSAIETDYNTPEMHNLVIQNIWIEHYKTGIWTHNLKGLHVVGCRIRNTFADGMNLRRGTSDSVAEQCSVRNTGDDAIALWSSDYSDTNNSIRFNTVSLPWLANNIALYGGTDIEIADNIIRDTVGMGAGINISSNFDPKPFGETITAARNTLVRCGSFNVNYNMNSGAIWFNTVSGNDNHANVLVKDNVLEDSTWQGISFMNKGTVDKVLLEGNVIDSCGSFGLDIAAGARGAATVRNNAIRNAMLGEISNEAEDEFKLTVENTKVTEPVRPHEQIPLLMIIIPAAVIAAALLFLMKRVK